jgi:cysteinyl-tRNA synthetase
VSADADAACWQSFRTVMDDDLNTPAAMAIVFDAITQANAAADAGDQARAHELVAAIYSIAEAVGLTFATGDDVPADISAKAAALDAARAAKDFAAADALRAELQAAGWTVETTKAGTTVRR